MQLFLFDAAVCVLTNSIHVGGDANISEGIIPQVLKELLDYPAQIFFGAQ